MTDAPATEDHVCFHVTPGGPEDSVNPPRESGCIACRLHADARRVRSLADPASRGGCSVVTPSLSNLSCCEIF